MTEIEHVPTVERRDAFDYLGIEVRASLRDWSEVNACVPELLAWMEDRGVRAAGAPFYRIVRAGSVDEPFEVVVGVPVDGEDPGDERVSRSTMPAGVYATYLLTAWFDEVWQVHDSVNRWLEREGRTLDTEDDAFVAFYEQYLTDPQSEPDPDRQQTFVAYKLRSVPEDPAP